MLQKSQHSSYAYWSGKSKVSIKYVARSARSADATFALGTSHSWIPSATMKRLTGSSWESTNVTSFGSAPAFVLFLLQLLAFILDKSTYRKITISINKIIYKTVTSIISHRVHNTTLCWSVAGRPSSCKNPMAVQVNLDISRFTWTATGCLQLDGHIINANVVDLGQRNSKSHI